MTFFFHVEDFSKDRFLHIFDSNSLEEKIPGGFDAVKITLDGKLDSSLDWKLEKKAAAHFISQGLQVFWELDLGLFSFLKHSLLDQAQYVGLKLSIDYFKDSIWKEFSEQTLGMSIYRGSADLGQGFLWNDSHIANFSAWLKKLKNTEVFDPEKENLTVKEQFLVRLFCQNASLDYLDLITGQIPDPLSTFLLVETEDIKNPVLLGFLLSKQRLGRLQIGQTKSGAASVTAPNAVLGREITPFKEKQSSTGICLPLLEHAEWRDIEALSQVAQNLKNTKTSYRVIEEDFLTTEWDGLDTLWVAKEAVSPQGKRKVQGFIAAGGQVKEL